MELKYLMNVQDLTKNRISIGKNKTRNIIMDRDIYFEKVKGLICIGFDYCTSIDYDVYAESYEKEIN